MTDDHMFWKRSALRRIQTVDALLDSAETHAKQQSTKDAIEAAREMLIDVEADIDDMEAQFDSKEEDNE